MAAKRILCHCDMSSSSDNGGSVKTLTSDWIYSYLKATKSSRSVHFMRAVQTAGCAFFLQCTSLTKH